MKFCNTCNRWLPESEFYKNRCKRDGLASNCKQCQKQYDIEHKKQRLEYAKQYREEHKKQNRQYHLNYIKEYNAKPEVKERHNELKKKQYENDPKYRIDHQMHSIISGLLRNRKLNSPVLLIRCGYSADDLRKYLESQFTPEMNWDNYGSYWEIDHIVSKSNFNYTSYEDDDFKKCWTLNNLRPLSVIDNRSRDRC